MANQIIVHEFHQQPAALEWIKSNAVENIIIPLQPLFIDGVPNILPLPYFFMNEPLDNYPLFNGLHDALAKHAPKNLSEKSIRSIAMDCFNMTAPMVHSYEWIHAAMTEYHHHPIAITAKRDNEKTMKSAAQWINEHRELIVFGVCHNQLKRLIDLMNCMAIPIHWVVPSTKESCEIIPLARVMDWVQTWSNLTFQYAFNGVINGFESIEDECHHVIAHAKQVPGKVAVVVPNDPMKQWLMIEGKKQGVLIRDNAVLLKHTRLGADLWELLAWVSTPTLAQFNRLIHALNWPELSVIKQNVVAMLALTPYKKEQALTKEHFEGHDMGQKLLALRSISDIKHMVFEWEYPYGLDDDTYFQYQCHQIICNLLDLAEKEAHPMRFIQYMLDHQTIDARTCEDPKIICITPESLGKVPSHSLWVMGLGNETWKPLATQPYLTSEGSSQDPEINAIRHSYAAWCLSHPHLMGASMPLNINDRQNHVMDGLTCEFRQVQLPHHEASPLLRKPMATTPVAPLPMSPSSLALYQRCPYAYYIKHHLRISSHAPASEYQMIGFLVHNIVEKLATKELMNLQDIQSYLGKEYSPLMAQVMENILTTHWPMEDIVSFFKPYDGCVETEKALHGTMEGIELNGRADIVITGESTIEIVDIKSGSIPTKKDIATYNYIQLGVYAILLKLTHASQSLKASLLSKGPKIQTPIDTSDQHYNAYEEGLMQVLRQLFNGLKQAKFGVEHATSSEKEIANQCRVCDVYHACHKRERHQR
jgi:RecB family exonuclease